MKQVMINGHWESPPPHIDLADWLNEIIAVELDMELLIPKRYILRFELIRAVRESSKHKAKSMKVVRSL